MFVYKYSGIAIDYTQNLIVMQKEIVNSEFNAHLHSIACNITTLSCE